MLAPKEDGDEKKREDGASLISSGVWNVVLGNG